MQSILQYRRIRQRIDQERQRHVPDPSEVPLGQTDSNKHIEEDAGDHSPRSPDASPDTIEKGQTLIMVDFDSPTDTDNPQNWSTWKKTSVMMIISAIAFIVGFGSSIDAPVIPQAAQRFHVSDVSESLATGIYLIGFGAGAPFAGPLSEAFGRNPVYTITFSLYCIWIMGAGLAPNLGAQLAFRFLAGFCGSTPFTTAGGTLADLYTHEQRGKIFPLFAYVAFVGPMISPVVGGYVGVSGISWRWTEWITLIISGTILVVLIIFMPETYAPVLIRWKAQHLRAVTGKDHYRAPIDVAQETFGQKLIHALSRPFSILFTEPIVILFTLHLTLVYLVAFSFFSSFPYIFGETYHFSQGSTYLMFLGIVFGLTIVVLATPLFGLLLKREAIRHKDQHHPPPEAMLWWSMFGAPALPISLFWMAWSAYPFVSYWSPLIAATLFGFSLLTLFISTYAYLIQTFAQYAASALVSITFVRYIVSGAMVVVSIPMFENLGAHHALTVLGGLSVGFMPLPFVFYMWGDRVRGWSRAAPTK